MPPLRLGIIGLGLAARDLHWPALSALSRKFRVAVVCNHTIPKARSFAKLAGGVPWTQDYRAVLESDEVDAVDIVLPVELNLKVTRDALKAGKHVIVEKPLATSLKECREMVKLEKATKPVTMVAENFRYRPGLKRLRKLMKDGTFGDVYAVQWMAATDLAPETSAYGRTQWRIDHKYPGGYPMDGGVHWANAIRMLFGEVTRVSSWTTAVNPKIGDVDTHYMQFDTAEGVHGTYCHSFSAKAHHEDRLTIFGTKATGVVEDGRLVLKQRGRKERTIDLKDDGGYRGQFEAFHGAITKGTPVETPFEEGLRDFAVIEASLRSGKTGKSVKLKG